MSVTILEGDLSAPLTELLASSVEVAVDTETSGLHWERDRLELCQLFSPTTGPVLLRNVEGVPHRLAGLLGDPTVLKVFHFAPFDLRFLEAQWGVRTQRVECTKTASRILDPQAPTSEHSLKPILKKHLGIEINKGSVRTGDWGSEELSEEQIAYAATDVEHLLDLAHVLRRGLQVVDRLELFAQVCAYLPTDAHLAVAGLPNPLIY